MRCRFDCIIIIILIFIVIALLLRRARYNHMSTPYADLSFLQHGGYESSFEPPPPPVSNINGGDIPSEDIVF